MNNLSKIKNEINGAKLIAVTKNENIETINNIIELGVTDIAENKVQILLEKYDKINGDVNIHFIGHLQRNKVKYIVGIVDLIHSIDSIRLAREINKEAQKKDVIQSVLIQINIAKEPQKYGVMEDELDQVIYEISTLKYLKVEGFMLIAPFTENKDELESYFKKMKLLFDYYKNNNYNNVYMKYLSMGMSNDYMLAIKCGSNMVRIGRALFSGGNNE